MTAATMPARILPTRLEIKTMLTDRVLALAAMICSTVVICVVTVTFGWAATHHGDILVMATAVASVVGSIAGTFIKKWGNGNGNSP